MNEITQMEELEWEQDHLRSSFYEYVTEQLDTDNTWELIQEHDYLVSGRGGRRD